jgi:uncharacterized protein (TIGR02646 family)
MIYIEKHEEPEWLAEFKQNNPQATYDSKEFKPYISRLNEVLVKEQKHLCAYCCGKIDTNKSHNEHIEPRNPGKYASNKSLDYRNIVASCYGFQGDKTCGMKKANGYDETQFISPLNPECENVFKYLPNGKMEGDTYTIDLLNLNSYRLRKAREAVYNTLAELDENTIKLIYSESEEVLTPFMNVIKWYLKNELPSNKE